MIRDLGGGVNGMQSDDQFRLAFDAAIARLAAWADTYSDSATVQTESVGQYWRLSLAPQAANACPVEVILHRDTQSFDIQLGSETYECNRIEAFEIFDQILAAVVDGRVVTRHLASANSGAVVAIETGVSLTDTADWNRRRTTEIGANRMPEDVLVRERQWLAYRR